jgi:hypothetical protein
MKTIRLNFKAGATVILGAAALMILLLSSCATKVPFQYSAEAPAARGTAKVKKDNNNNYMISVELVNLSEADRLVAPKTAYVVWMASGTNSAKNLGKIQSESSMISKTLKASFETVSAEKPTKIFITSEEDGNASYPSSSVILTTNNF